MRNKKQEILKMLKSRGVVSSQKNDPAIAKSIKSKRVHSTKSKRVHSTKSKRVPWFFPDGDMEAGWTYAFGLAYWTIDEFAAFSLGKNPEKVSWEQVKPLINIEEQAREYARRMELARRAVNACVLPDRTPRTFIQWAVGIHLDLPDELLKQLGERSPDPGSFSDLESLSWEDISITLLSGGHIQISARDMTRKVSLGELSLKNKTTNQPNKSFELLAALSGNPRKAVRMNPKLKDIAYTLRKSLKTYFGITSDPLSAQGQNYVARFGLIDKRDAADRRAKEKASRSTVPFDEHELSHQRGDSFQGEPNSSLGFGPNDDGYPYDEKEDDMAGDEASGWIAKHDG
jgi:hypothetical protein